MKTIPIILLFFVACTANRNETKAKIIERKMLPDSQLMLHYTYTIGDKIITDSAITNNRVIPHDSVTVIYSSSGGKKSELKFP